MSARRSITLRLTPLELEALDDALAYYAQVSVNNFDAGYERGDGEEKAKHTRADRLSARVSRLRQKEDR